MMDSPQVVETSVYGPFKDYTHPDTSPTYDTTTEFKPFTHLQIVEYVYSPVTCLQKKMLATTRK